MDEYLSLSNKWLLFLYKQSTFRVLLLKSECFRQKKNGAVEYYYRYFVQNDHFHKTNFQSHFLNKYLLSTYYWPNIVLGSKLTTLNTLRPVLRKITKVVNLYFPVLFFFEPHWGCNSDKEAGTILWSSWEQ